MPRIRASLLGFFLLCTFFLGQSALAEPAKQSLSLTDESVSSLLNKGDHLFQHSTCADPLGALTNAEDAYYRAWIQAKDHDLPLASHKFAQPRIKKADCFLSEGRYETALNHYLAALALLTYPALSLERIELDQSDSYKKLTQQVQQTLPYVSSSVDTADNLYQMGKIRIHQGRHISALGLYMLMQAKAPNDQRSTQAIQETLNLINQRRKELDEKRDSVWFYNISNAKNEEKFVKYLAKKVRNNWQSPILNTNYNGSVDFYVNSDGTLTDITIRKTSGNIDFDASMIRAVQNTSPIPTKGLLSKVLQGQSQITINEVFDYERKPNSYY